MSDYGQMCSFDDAIKWAYCPHCGAKMDGGEE